MRRVRVKRLATNENIENIKVQLMQIDVKKEELSYGLNKLNSLMGIFDRNLLDINTKLEIGNTELQTANDKLVELLENDKNVRTDLNEIKEQIKLNKLSNDECYENLIDTINENEGQSKVQHISCMNSIDTAKESQEKNLDDVEKIVEGTEDNKKAIEKTNLCVEIIRGDTDKLASKIDMFEDNLREEYGNLKMGIDVKFEELELKIDESKEGTIKLQEMCRGILNNTKETNTQMLLTWKELSIAVNKQFDIESNIERGKEKIR
jgi:hypothetical protein